MNILVTDANYKHTLGIIRHLGLAGYKSYALSSAKKSLASYSKYCKGEILTPSYDAENFLDLFLNILRNYNIDLIIPVGTNSFKALVPHKNAITQYSKMMTVDQDKLNLCFSKQLTYKFAENIGIPVPKSFYPQKISDIETIKDQITYPCVIKGLFEVGGNIVAYVYNKTELYSKYINICKEFNLNEQNGLPLVQEYIKGDGCGFFAIYNHGKCGPVFQHRRIRELPPSGGMSVAAESFHHPLLLEYGKKLLDSLDWHGVAMVEFKLVSNNKLVLMEINPKFWGSVDLALTAGINFPYEIVKSILGKNIEFSNKYKYPLKYHWPMHGDLEHAIINRKNILPVLFDCLNPKVKSNLWIIKDIKPTLVSIYRFIGIVTKLLYKKFLNSKFEQ